MAYRLIEPTVLAVPLDLNVPIPASVFDMTTESSQSTEPSSETSDETSEDTSEDTSKESAERDLGPHAPVRLDISPSAPVWDAEPVPEPAAIGHATGYICFITHIEYSGRVYITHSIDPQIRVRYMNGAARGSLELYAAIPTADYAMRVKMLHRRLARRREGRIKWFGMIRTDLDALVRRERAV